MPTLTTRAPEEVGELPLELLWDLYTPPATTAQCLLLEVFLLKRGEREKLFDLERVFIVGRPRGNPEDYLFSSRAWHRGNSNSRGHLAFPHEAIAERLAGKLDPFRLTLGLAELEGAFHELLGSLLQAEARLDGPVDDELRALVQAQSTTVLW